MGIVRDRLAALNIRVVSADESVEVVLTKTNGIKVRLEDDVADFHSEESLSEEIEEALRGAMDGYQQAVGMIRAEAFGEERALPPKGSKSASQLESYMQAGEEIEVEAQSPRGFVKMEWRGSSDFLIALREKSLAKLDTPALEKEINQAIANASRSHAEEVLKIQKTVFKHDRFTR